MDADFSFRIAKGVYYRIGGFAGTPIETTQRIYVDTGPFAVTNKHVPKNLDRMVRPLVNPFGTMGNNGKAARCGERLYVLTPLGRTLLDKLPTPPKFKNQAEYWRWAMARYKEQLHKNELRKRINRREAG
jgi:hypothetical protein